MKYISTRGIAPSLNFEEVLLTGLASDGGLYVPEKYPFFSYEQIKNFQKLSYVELASKIMAPFTEGSLTEQDLLKITSDVYSKFNHSAIAPLKQIQQNLWIMELFQGPTLAFKDYALQVVGKLFDFILKKNNKKITIVGATSGDTGSAAIEGCKRCSNVDIFILHPYGRVSDVQRRQMTTVISKNVYNIALKGTFDDCQSFVKNLFANKNFKEKYNLAAVNSINWARIMAQVVYYFYAALNLGAPDREVSFAVPTGNFGNIFAGYVAKRMGLPIKNLILGSNSNDILPRFIHSGIMEKKDVKPSISPSMDIQISSNFERILFEICDRNSQKVAQLMEGFKSNGKYSVSMDVLQTLTSFMKADAFNDQQTLCEISRIYKTCQYILDPHSAIGLMVAEKYREKDVPMIVLATAHPAKFPKPINEAIGVCPELPFSLKNLMNKEENYIVLENKIQDVIDFIEKCEGK